jgi:hypothetical protein
MFNLTEPVARQLASDLNAATVNAKIAKCAKEWAEAKEAFERAKPMHADDAQHRLQLAWRVLEAAESALLAAVKESK